VLLLAPHSSYRIAAYCEAARRLGIKILVASQGVHSLIPEAAQGLHIDLHDPPKAVFKILTAASNHPIAGVVATDDATVELASHAAAALGLPYNSPEAARIARRKDLGRSALAAAGLPVPEFRRLDLARDLLPQTVGLRFPCVLKPLALSGSRGVMRVDSPEALVQACGRMVPILAAVEAEEERRFVLVEEFLPGFEVAVEGLLVGGKLHLLALFDKPDPLDGPFFEETCYILPSRLDAPIRQRIRRRVEEGCAAYGMQEGPVHAELRIGQGDVWILEIAARTIGGDCARLLRFTGQSLEELILRHALGLPWHTRLSEEAAGVLMIPIPEAGVLRRVEGVLAARRVAYIEEVEIAVREGYELVPLPEGGSYLGFIFARGPSPATVEQALREAHACLKFVVAPVLHPELLSRPSAKSLG
jgi:biotin carboxylase